MALRSRSSAAALLALSLAVLSACDRQPVGAVDNPSTSAPALNGLPANPPGREDAGFLSFTYSGDEEGRFFAFGEADSVSGTTPMGADFAAATHYFLGLETRQDLGTSITSTARGQAGLSDLAHIQFPGVLQPGTYTISTCGRGGGPFCPLIGLVFDVDNSVLGGGTQARYYEFRGGTITITSVEDGRAAGTFSGTAVSTDWSTGETRTIVITDGRFDVPVTEVDSARGE
jgi:hypothetical protein